MEDVYSFADVEFRPTQFSDGFRLKTEQIENTQREFKGFGKLMSKSKIVTDNEWKAYVHQIPEFQKQLAAMLNTKGGHIFLGVGSNGVIKGGDYTYKDKEDLLSFLKNFTIHYGIAGKGLIEEPEFHEIPHEYVSTFPNTPNSKRYLVTIKIHPSNKPVYIDKEINMRDLGGVAVVDYNTWLERRFSNETKQKKSISPKIIKSYVDAASR